jgi:hypothetical protein
MYQHNPGSISMKVAGNGWFITLSTVHCLNYDVSGAGSTLIFTIFVVIQVYSCDCWEPTWDILNIHKNVPLESKYISLSAGIRKIWVWTLRNVVSETYRNNNSARTWISNLTLPSLPKSVTVTFKTDGRTWSWWLHIFLIYTTWKRIETRLLWMSNEHM